MATVMAKEVAAAKKNHSGGKTPGGDFRGAVKILKSNTHQAVDLARDLASGLISELYNRSCAAGVRVRWSGIQGVKAPSQNGFDYKNHRKHDFGNMAYCVVLEQQCLLSSELVSRLALIGELYQPALAPGNYDLAKGVEFKGDIIEFQLAYCRMDAEAIRIVGGHHVDDCKEKLYPALLNAANAASNIIGLVAARCELTNKERREITPMDYTFVIELLYHN